MFLITVDYGDLLALRILVTGLIAYESGKTWFTLSSAMYTRSIGIKTRVFKPVAGHNLWYNPRTIETSLKHRVLVGNDISLYLEKGFVENPAMANPIAIATVPLDPMRYEGGIHNYLLEIEQLHSTVVVSRITNCSSGEFVHYYYPENFSKTTSVIRDTLEKLVTGFNARESKIRSLMDYLTSSEVERNLDLCLERLSEDTDILFIESFNDAITPYPRVLDLVEYVVIVAPGRVFLYDDVHSIKRIILEKSSGLGTESLRSINVFGHIKHAMTIETDFMFEPMVRSPHKAIMDYIIRDQRRL